MVDVHHHLPRLDVRILQDLLVAVDRAARDLGRIHALDPMRRGLRPQHFLDFFFQLVDVGQP